MISFHEFGCSPGPTTTSATMKARSSPVTSAKTSARRTSQPRRRTTAVLSPTLDDLERPLVDRLGHLIVDGQTLVQSALFHNVHTRPAFPSKRPIRTFRTASGEIPPGVSSCHSPSM